MANGMGLVGIVFSTRYVFLLVYIFYKHFSKGNKESETAKSYLLKNTF